MEIPEETIQLIRDSGQESHSMQKVHRNFWGIFGSPYMCKQALWGPWQKQVDTQKIMYSILKMKVIRENDTAFEEKLWSCS